MLMNIFLLFGACFSFSYFHSPNLFFETFEEIRHHIHGAFILWMDGMYGENFQCRSFADMWSVRDLDHISMKSISQGSHQFDKAQNNDKKHMCRDFQCKTS